MTASQTSGQPGGALWPADVIHVNEDGWVLINRGSRHGVSVGLRLLVVGTGARELRDLFAPDASSETQPPVLRIRRTYELLEVVYAEDTCAIAIATRTPATRRPTVYRGPEGELLVWVPLPEGYSWPPRDNVSTRDEEQPQPAEPPWDAGESDDAGDEAPGAYDAPDTSDEAGAPDTPPERAPQDDEPWEEALPLNSVSVGDIVLPAIPAAPSSPSLPTDPSAQEPVSPLEQGRAYDWIKKPGE